MFPTKAPGPDGFPALFYQKDWDVVGLNTTNNCLEILNAKKGIEDQNKTNIILIPKSVNPQTNGDYRPISLCNVRYKIVTKVLANQLKHIRKIVYEVQSAFIPGRLIIDNIIVGHECLHAFKNIKSGRKGQATIKLDISKAYDRVEWSFLKEIMRKLGFNPNWINLILNCISTVNFSIMINKEPKGSFAPNESLRQGDPLLIFIDNQGSFFSFAGGKQQRSSSWDRMRPNLSKNLTSSIRR